MRKNYLISIIELWFKEIPITSNMQNDKKGRAFWGPHYWTVIHSIAASYRPEKATAFMNFIHSLTFLLPCDQCRENLKANLAKYPPEPYLRNNNDLFFWTYLLHDAVNQEHNREKPTEPKKYSPPFENVKKFYYSALGEDCKACDKP